VGAILAEAKRQGATAEMLSNTFLKSLGKVYVLSNQRGEELLTPIG
jgi:hypothetical protein